MALTDSRIRKAKSKAQAYKLSDGGGMYLLVMPNGARYWRLDYRFAGKRRTLALGVYPTVTLSNARARREDARACLAKDIDPLVVKKQTKRAARHANENTFEGVAREWIENQHKRLAPRYRAQLLARLEVDIFPQIGARPVSQVDALELLDTLRKVERRGVIEGTLRRRQPVWLLVLARRFVLDIESQAAIGVLDELRQHRRVEQVAVDRIGDDGIVRPMP